MSKTIAQLMQLSGTVPVGYNYDQAKFRAELKQNLNLGTLTQLVSGASIRRFLSSIFYNDGTNNKMVVFGGYDGTLYLNDVWEYNLDTNVWGQRPIISSTLPIARSRHAAIYYNDGTNNKMVVFGGYDGTSYLNDVWEYNLDTNVWTQLTSGATARYDHTSIFYNDGTNNKMVVFGGYDGTSYLNDVWEYNLDTNVWTQLTSGATARELSTMIYYSDNDTNKMIIFGGNDGTVNLNDVWEYNLDTNIWSNRPIISSTLPIARSRHAAIYYNDGVNNKMVVLGGYDGTNTLSDVWEYNLDTNVWTQLTSFPTLRRECGIIIYNDGTNNKMVVFGGYDGTSYLNDVWEYNLYLQYLILRPKLI